MDGKLFGGAWNAAKLQRPLLRFSIPILYHSFIIASSSSLHGIIGTLYQ